MATERQPQQGVKGFKRINFFKGFLTTEHDWNDAERYHVEKRKLHNRCLHAPGVVLGYGGELKVIARARGDLSIEVQSGYAIDGQGNDLVLWDTVIKTIIPEEFKLPQTIYVVLRYVEELTDFIAYKENLEYKGHRRVLEGARVELSQSPPEIGKEVELARIMLEKGAARVRDARDPLDPKANEIDMRFVPRAGVAGAGIDPQVRIRIHAVLEVLKRGLVLLGRNGVDAAHDALQANLATLMMEGSNLLSLPNLFVCLDYLVEMENEVVVDVETNHPALAGKKEFGEYKKHIEVLKGLLGERKVTSDALANFTAFQQKAAELTLTGFQGEKPVAQATPKGPAKEEKKELPKPTAQDWEAVKGLSNIAEQVELEGRQWVLVDQIDVLEKDSEEGHAFEIKDAKDTYRSRQKLKYPDGQVVEDTGRAHVGGFATYKVKNVTPGRELAIIRRMDYVYGDYELEFQVDGKSVGVSSCAGTDRVNRWRNWPFVVPSETVTASTVTIKQIATTAGRDVNMFKLWFYQPK